MTAERRRNILAVAGRVMLIKKSIRDTTLERLNNTTKLSELKAKRVVETMIKNRRRSCEELLATERSYNGFVRALHEYVLVPLQARREFTDSEKAFMASNVAEILALSDAFIADLAARLEGWSDETTTVGDVILKHVEPLGAYAPFFRVQGMLAPYIEFMCRHSYALDIMVKYFLLRLNFLGVNDVLIMPVQRPMRYGLLTNEIMKNTPEGHPDRKFLEEAVVKVPEKVAELNRAVDPEKTGNFLAVVRRLRSLAAPADSEDSEDSDSDEKGAENEGKILTIVRERHEMRFGMPVRELVTKSVSTDRKEKYRRPYCLFLSKEIVVLKERGGEDELLAVVPLSEVSEITTKDLTFMFRMKDYICNVVFDESRRCDMDAWEHAVIDLKK